MSHGGALGRPSGHSPGAGGSGQAAPLRVPGSYLIHKDPVAVLGSQVGLHSLQRGKENKREQKQQQPADAGAAEVRPHRRGSRRRPSEPHGPCPPCPLSSTHPPGSERGGRDDSGTVSRAPALGLWRCRQRSLSSAPGGSIPSLARLAHPSVCRLHPRALPHPASDSGAPLRLASSSGAPRTLGSWGKYVCEAREEVPAVPQAAPKTRVPLGAPGPDTLPPPPSTLCSVLQPLPRPPGPGPPSCPHRSPEARRPGRGRGRPARPQGLREACRQPREMRTGCGAGTRAQGWKTRSLNRMDTNTSRLTGLRTKPSSRIPGAEEPLGRRQSSVKLTR